MKAFTPHLLSRQNIFNSHNDRSGVIGYKKGAGFTLVEVLVVVLIFSFIFMALFMVLAGGQSAWYTGDVQIELNQEIRKAIFTMDRQLRQTRTSVISGVPADDNYYTTITFKVPQDLDGDGDVIDSLGNLEWSGDITYSLNANNQIIRSTLSGSSILANNISSLQFRRPYGNPEIVQIYITAQKTTVLGRNLQAGIMSSVKVRN